MYTIRNILLSIIVLLPLTISSPRMRDLSRDNIMYLKQLTLFTKILNAEYYGESLQSKINGGSVILNRLNHKAFPKTLRAVIFQKNQFAVNGKKFLIDTSVYTKQSLQAAMLLLTFGSQLPPNIVYFHNPKTIKNKKWEYKIKKKLYMCDEVHCYFSY